MIRQARRALPVLLCILSQVASASEPRVEAENYLNHVKFLASVEMKGRGTGTPELDKAARYLARQFESFGLPPVNGKSYFQEFPVTTNASLGKENRFEYSVGQDKHSLRFQQEFIPFNFSGRGKFAGGVVFAGYGITAREYNYDDYAGLDVNGKFVVVLRHEPQEFEENSVFAGKVYTEHSQFFSKAVNARLHGARGVIFVNDGASHTGGTDDLEPFGNTVGPQDAGIPFVHLKEDVAQRWATPAGKNLRKIQEEIDKDLQPRGFAFPAELAVRMQVDLKREVRQVRNVAGYLPGELKEYIVIGAHYDHLGLGTQFSMAPSMAGTPHPGADDNASGTAGVLELARYFAGQPRRQRGLLFMAFAGEELGLLGSSFFVNHPALPLDKAVAMINLDMIGRIRDGKVYVGGLGTGTTLKPLVERLASGAPLKLEFSDQTGYGSSDHTSFTAKQVPVLFFFSGLHGDYHKPSDTWDKIEAKPAAELLTFIAKVTDSLAAEQERPQFVRLGAQPAAGSGPLAGSSSRSGYGPYFGSIPDFAEIPNGVRFSDVRDASPAAKAGLKGGDILVEFDGKPVKNLYDFTYLLRSKKAGERVKVKVLRDGQPLEADVLLENRK